jgi:hypothetical protein
VPRDASIERDGYAIVDDVVTPAALAEYRARIAGIAVRAGVRDLLHVVPETLAFVRASRVPSLVRGMRIVRAILFDKSTGANWRVPWHRDTPL